jgi:folate-binding protein YgfZ
MTAQEKPYFIPLPDRGLIKIGGADRFDFLQALISNDLALLKTQNMIYACLLTPQGKFLHDFFVSEHDEEIWLECDGGARTQDLYMRLLMYKLRSKITIEADDDHAVYAVFNTDAHGFKDPRHHDMGYRAYVAPADLAKADFDVWDTRRIMLGIADGSRDMIVEKSTLLDYNIDQFNGVCYKKGCYVGQELTARMHYRGLAKKSLYVVRGDNLPDTGADIMNGEALIGEMRSRCGTIGLALLKIKSLETADLTSLGFEITAAP